MRYRIGHALLASLGICFMASFSSSGTETVPVVSGMRDVHLWDIYELVIQNCTISAENITAKFYCDGEEKTVHAFYDGEATRKLRFMPAFQGEYHFEISGLPELTKGMKGHFHVLAPLENNHGPVHPVGKFHFAHEDGTPYYPVGTTCYAWIHQPEKVRKQTIETLSKGFFNKIRFCIFPKHYVYNEIDPEIYPFELKQGSNKENDWDLNRPNVKFFSILDEAIMTLRNLGIEADIILFHPYDKWGFSSLSADDNDKYLKYITARYSAYCNVWWSLANEYDILKNKTIADWDHYGDLIIKNDPWNHLRSIHNCVPFYDFTKNWVTHCSIQRQDFYVCAELTDKYREKYNKPVVLDEIVYEGNIPPMWGNISGQELVRRFWEATVRGGYATHGETYESPDGILWWSHGGVLHGDSPARLKFLSDILKQTPGNGLRHIKAAWDDNAACAETDSDYMLYYFGRSRPKHRDMYNLDPNASYHVEVIDTWNMTIKDYGIMKGRFQIELPGIEYIAMRIRKIK